MYRNGVERATGRTGMRSARAYVTGCAVSALTAERWARVLLRALVTPEMRSLARTDKKGDRR